MFGWDFSTKCAVAGAMLFVLPEGRIDAASPEMDISLPFVETIDFILNPIGAFEGAIALIDLRPGDASSIVETMLPIPEAPPQPAPPGDGINPPVAPAAPSPLDPLFLKRVAELNRPMSGVGFSLPEASGPQPKDQAAQQFEEVPPILISAELGWVEPPVNRYPVSFSYQPLYYEDRNLERCGEGHGYVQPLFSSIAFAKDTILLPYYLATSPPRSEEYTPGDCPTDYEFPRFPH